MTVRPLRDVIYIERIRREMTEGGIHIPSSFDHQNRPSLKLGAVPDYFEARVLAVGPQVDPLVAVGSEIAVHTYVGGDTGRLWTGEDGGQRDRMFIRPDDIVFVRNTDDDVTLQGIE